MNTLDREGGVLAMVGTGAGLAAITLPIVGIPTWFDWLNGYGSSHTDTLSQTVTIPAGYSSAMLQFYMHIDTAETTTAATDKLTVAVYNTSGTLLGTLYTYSNLNANASYALRPHAMKLRFISNHLTDSRRRSKL